MIAEGDAIEGFRAELKTISERDNLKIERAYLRALVEQGIVFFEAQFFLRLGFWLEFLNLLYGIGA